MWKLKDRRRILPAITMIMVVLTIISAFFYRTDYRGFFLGNSVDNVSEKLENGSEIRIDVENKQKITIEEVVLSMSWGNGAGKQQTDGIVNLEIINNKDEVVGRSTISGAMWKEERIHAKVDGVKEIKGDFTIRLSVENFESGNAPLLYLSNRRDVSNPLELKSTLYINEIQTAGYPCIAMGTMHRDNFYFPAAVLILMILLIIQIGIKLKKKMDIKIISFLLIGGYLLLELWTQKADEICSWIGPWYVLDYGVGIGSRFFIGSIMKVLFYDNFLDKSVAYNFVLTGLSILVILLAYLLAKSIASTEKESRRGIIFIILCYITSPGSVGYLWNFSNFGRFDMYLMLLALVAVVINCAVKNCVVRYVLLAGISCCMFAIHQGNLFTYFPVIYMLCICNVFYDNKIRWKEVVGSLFVALTSAATFLYFHFFATIKFETLNEMSQYVGGRTNLRNNESGLHMEYFSGEYGMFANCFALENYRLGGVIQLIVLWPLTLLEIWIVIKIFKRLKEMDKKAFLSPYPYLLIFDVMYIPLFTFECDWGRWFAAIITTKIIAVLYLFYIKNPEMEFVIRKYSDFLKNKEWAMVFTLLYLAMMEKFGAVQFLTIVERIYTWLFPFAEW